MAYDFQRIAVDVRAGVAVATIDNPPINLLTIELLRDLVGLGREIEADDDVRVLVLRSANPDFFIAHFDVQTLIDSPTEGEPVRGGRNGFHEMCDKFRVMPKATIAQIEGRVGGGGSEMSMNFDMRFGVIGKTIVNQMEVPLGILPGGTGTQHLPRLVGRSRALEVILGGIDLDAETAEKWGYLNRALPADEIGPYVDALAERIASYPVEAVAAAKASVLCAEQDLREGLQEEAYLFQTLLRVPSAQANMRKFLKIGGHTPEGEMRVGELNRELGR